jgi:hypothetical protein
VCGLLFGWFRWVTGSTRCTALFAFTKSKRVSQYKLIMVRLVKLQFLGPLIMLVAVAMAEGAAFALGQMPTSETLWYLNLRVFGVFQTSYDLLCSSWGMPYAQFYLIALPPFVLAVIGLLARRRFLLALASHLSFAYAGFLVYCEVISETHAATASLIGVAIPTGPNVFLLVTLGGACLISFLVSQSQYLIGFLRIRARIWVISLNIREI